MLFHQRLERRGVAGGELVEHVLVAGSAGRFQNRPQVARQACPSFGVDDGFQRRVRLMPPRVVVELGDFLQAEGDVVVRPDPLRGIDHASLQRREDFRPRQRNRRTPRALKDLPAETRNAHFQAFHIGNGVDLLVEPPRHLRTGVPSRERHDAERRIEFPPQFQPAPVVQPPVRFLRVHPERHGGKHRRHRHLPPPVVRRPMPHLRRPLRNRVENLERRHELARRVHADLEPPARHRLHVLGQPLRCRPQRRQILRPRGDELPLDGLGRLRVAGIRLDACHDIVLANALFRGAARQRRDGHSADEERNAVGGELPGVGGCLLHVILDGALHRPPSW